MPGEVDAMAEEQRLRDLFDEIDIDGGGSLSRDEVAELSKVLGVPLSESDLNEAMRMMDADGGGEVDFDEFKEWWAYAKSSPAMSGLANELAAREQRRVRAALAAGLSDEEVERLLALFSQIDVDGGGTLDRDEVGELAKGIGLSLDDADLADAMAQMDDDRSGEVDFDEFCTWWAQVKNDPTSKFGSAITERLESEEATAAVAQLLEGRAVDGALANIEALLKLLPKDHRTTFEGMVQQATDSVLQAKYKLPVSNPVDSSKWLENVRWAQEKLISGMTGTATPNVVLGGCNDKLTQSRLDAIVKSLAEGDTPGRVGDTPEKVDFYPLDSASAGGASTKTPRTTGADVFFRFASPEATTRSMPIFWKEMKRYGITAKILQVSLKLLLCSGNGRPLKKPYIREVCRKPVVHMRVAEDGMLATFGFLSAFDAVEGFRRLQYAGHEPKFCTVDDLVIFAHEEANWEQFNKELMGFEKDVTNLKEMADLIVATERRLLRLAKSEAKKKSHRLMWTGVDHQRKIDNNATKIQAVFRGHMERTNETSELAQRKAERAKEIELQTANALIIQASYRVHLKRKRAMEAKLAKKAALAAARRKKEQEAEAAAARARAAADAAAAAAREAAEAEAARLLRDVEAVRRRTETAAALKEAELKMQKAQMQKQAASDARSKRLGGRAEAALRRRMESKGVQMVQLQNKVVTYVMFVYLFDQDALQIAYVAGAKQFVAWEIAWDEVYVRKKSAEVYALFRKADVKYMIGIDAQQWARLVAQRGHARTSARAHAELDTLHNAVMPTPPLQRVRPATASAAICGGAGTGSSSARQWAAVGSGGQQLWAAAEADRHRHPRSARFRTHSATLGGPGLGGGQRMTSPRSAPPAASQMQRYAHLGRQYHAQQTGGGDDGLAAEERLLAEWAALIDGEKQWTPSRARILGSGRAGGSSGERDAVYHDELVQQDEGVVFQAWDARVPSPIHACGHHRSAGRSLSPTREKRWEDGTEEDHEEEGEREDVVPPPGFWDQGRPLPSSGGKRPSTAPAKASSRRPYTGDGGTSRFAAGGLSSRRRHWRDGESDQQLTTDNGRVGSAKQPRISGAILGGVQGSAKPLRTLPHNEPPHQNGQQQEQDDQRQHCQQQRRRLQPRRQQQRWLHQSDSRSGAPDGGVEIRRVSPPPPRPKSSLAWEGMGVATRKNPSMPASHSGDVNGDSGTKQQRPATAASHRCRSPSPPPQPADAYGSGARGRIPIGYDHHQHHSAARATATATVSSARHHHQRPRTASPTIHGGNSDNASERAASPLYGASPRVFLSRAAARSPFGMPVVGSARGPGGKGSRGALSSQKTPTGQGNQQDQGSHHKDSYLRGGNRRRGAPALPT